MRIGIVGGIFGRGPVLRQKVWYTPETILHEGFRRLGHYVTALSHYEPIPGDLDVVHVHHLSFGAVRAACSASRTPFVFTVHSTKRGETWARELAFRFVFERADAVIALSEAERQSDAAAYRRRGGIHRVVFNGIDADMYRFAPKAPQAAGRLRSILCVAHLTPLKGHETLFRALARLPLDTELKLVYHGDALLAKLRRIADELGIAPRVQFLGAKNPHELRDLYQQAGVFVLPSESEALPSVVTEAMFCGTPVVATDVGGVREQLGDDGIVVPPKDADALATGIRQAFEDYPVWMARAGEISRRARERFSIETMLRRHLELYGELLGSGVCLRRSAAALPANLAAGAATNLICSLRGNPHLRSARQ